MKRLLACFFVVFTVLAYGQIDTVKIKNYSQIKPELRFWVEKINGCNQKYFLGKKLLVPQTLAVAEAYQGMPMEIADSLGRDSLILIDKKINRLGCYFGGKLLYWCPVTLGVKRMPTPSGSYKINGKYRMLISKKYGNIPMPYSLRFFGNYCIHQGPMPGRLASHGCVRVFKRDAIWLYNWAKIGVRIIIQ